MSLTDEQVGIVDAFLAKFREVLLNRLFDPYDNINSVTAEFRKVYNSSNTCASIMVVNTDVDTTQTRFEQPNGHPECTLVTVEDWHTTSFEGGDLVAAIQPIFDEFRMFFNYAVQRTGFFNGCVNSEHPPRVWFMEARSASCIQRDPSIVFAWGKPDDLLNDGNIIEAHYIEEMRQVFAELMHSFINTHAQPASSSLHLSSSAE